MSEPFLRGTVAMKRAVLDRLARLGEADDLDAFAEELVADVLTAEDSKTRWCVVVVDPHRNLTIFGPYASHATAMKAAMSGHLASLPNSTGQVLPLVNAPKKPRSPGTVGGAA